MGQTLRELCRRAPLKVPPWRPRLAAVIAEATDELFAEHAWLLGLRAGVVTVAVDDPGLLGVFRMQWHRPLREAFANRLRDLNIVDVRFRVAEPPDLPPVARPEPPDEAPKSTGNEDS
jgi:hypothetical protein